MLFLACLTISIFSRHRLAECGRGRFDLSGVSENRVASMRVAFYAPLKSPNHPVPSGDRQMARLLMKGLECAGHTIEVASELRSFSAEPLTDHYAVKMAEAEAEIARYHARLDARSQAGSLVHLSSLLQSAGFARAETRFRLRHPLCHGGSLLLDAAKYRRVGDDAGAGDRRRRAGCGEHLLHQTGS